MRFFTTGLVCAALLPAAIVPTAANAQAAAPGCAAPGALTRLDGVIARTAARLSEGRTLRVVALGSSSTAGAGASSPANAYPSRLGAELRERFPDMEIVVLNRGVDGEDAREMLARLEKSVIAEKPDLVLWQVGTNAIVNNAGLTEEASLVRRGLARIKASGADVILVDPQYAPRVISKPKAAAIVRMLQAVAQDANTGVFHRFAIMSHWRLVERVPFKRFTSEDGLHMNDWSYDCLAKLLAAAIVAGSSQPAPTATPRMVHQARS
jgi:lysophospholipase L1-like esterase